MFGIKQDRLAGMAAMLMGVASFSLMDASLKLLTAHYPAVQVAALRGMAALPVVFVWVLYAGGVQQLLRVRWPLHLIRGLLSVFMMVTFAFALKQLSLAIAYALFFVAPLLEFHRRLLAEGVKAGEFRDIDPVLFYTSLIGACDHLFFGRHAMSRATGVGPVTDEVCRDYIKHMEALIFGGMLNGKEEGVATG